MAIPHCAVKGCELRALLLAIHISIHLLNHVLGDLEVVIRAGNVQRRVSFFVGLEVDFLFVELL